MRGYLKIMENKELKERFINERTGIEYSIKQCAEEIVCNEIIYK